MSEANSMALEGPGPKRQVDLGLNIAIAVLLLAVAGLAAWFGYNIWVNQQRSQLTNAPMRVAAAVKAQVRKNPNDATLRVRLGEALGAAGKYKEAVEQLNQALKLEPKHVGAQFDLGLIALMTKKNVEAENYFKKVLELTEGSEFQNINTQREAALYQLGLLQLRKHNYEEAAGYFKGALRIRNDASDTYFGLAQALKGMGDADGALDQLHIAVQFDPRYVDAHYLMGEIYKAKKDDVNASYYYYQASQIAPDSDAIQEALAYYGPSSKWVAKAQADLEAGELDKAVEETLVARNLDPKNAEAAKLHGAILVKQKAFKDAVEVYLDAQKLAPKDEAVVKALRQLEAEHARSALAAYKAKLKKDPLNSEFKKKIRELQKSIGAQ